MEMYFILPPLSKGKLEIDKVNLPSLQSLFKTDQGVKVRKLDDRMLVL